MSLWDRILMGKVIKDFGVLEEKSLIFGKVRKSLFLVQRRGQLKIAFKCSGYSPFGGGMNYFDLSTESIPKLRQFLDEAQAIADQQRRFRSQRIEP
jgi:hypothetical protein